MTTEIVMLILGLAIGGVVVWLMLRGNVQNVADKAKAEAGGRCRSVPDLP